MDQLTLLIKPAAGLCNMRCRYCFYRAASEEHENKIMTGDTVAALLDAVAAAQPAAVSFLFQGGEPTLAGLDFYRDFAAQAKQRLRVPVSYGLQTNGLLLDDAFASFFKEHGFLLGVSLDGGRSTNDRYRRTAQGESVLPQVLQGISVLKKHGVAFNILSVIDDENAREITRTWSYFKKHGFRFLQFIPFVDEGGGVTLTPAVYGQFLNDVFDLWYQDYIKGDYVSVRHIDNYIGILCGRQPESCAMSGLCGHYFVVEANGDLYPCDFYCTQAHRIGTVFDEAPFALNDAHRAFIAASERIHAHCRDCRYYALCRGDCRRDRIDEGTKNRYCDAYKQFFDYAADRMAQIAATL